MRCAQLILVPIFLMLAAPALAERPTHRIAIVIGNNIGGPKEAILRFAEREASEVARVLEELGGFQPEWTYNLLGQAPAALRRTFTEVKERIKEIGPAGRVLLVVYYSGHADTQGLHLGADVFTQAELRRFITGSGASLGVGIVDACHSGTLAKGVRRGPAYDVSTLDAGPNTRGHVIITSSGPEEASQEDDAISGSYFTHYLISGLRGGADLSRDGLVTLSELYHYTYTRTLERTTASWLGPQHAAREVDLRGSGEVVMTRLKAANATLVFDEGLTGTFFVVRKRRTQVMAEVALSGKGARIAVPADTYLIRTRTEARLLVAQKNLSWGGEHTLKAEDFQSYAIKKTLARGAVEPSPHRLALLALVGTTPVAAKGPAIGSELLYLFRVGAFAVGGRVAWARSSFSTVDARVENDELEGALSGAWFAWEDTLDLWLGLRAGMVMVHQRIDVAPGRTSLGGRIEGTVEIAYPIRDPVFVHGGLNLGVFVYERFESGLQVRPSIRGSLGISARF